MTGVVGIVGVLGAVQRSGRAGPRWHGTHMEQCSFTGGNLR